MTVPEMASFLRISVPPLEKLRSALLNAGYSVSGSHCDPNAIKTTAPDQFLWKTLIEWVLKGHWALASNLDFNAGQDREETFLC